MGLVIEYWHCHWESTYDASNYYLFETSIGWLGIAWSKTGVTQLQLPERDRATTERRLRRRIASGVETTPPAEVADSRRDVESATPPASRSNFPTERGWTSEGCDAFRLAIYDAARKLSYGETTTYGELALAPATRAKPATPARPLAGTLFRSLFPATVSLRPATRSAVFRRRAAPQQGTFARDGRCRVGPPSRAQASFGF